MLCFGYGDDAGDDFDFQQDVAQTSGLCLCGVVLSHFTFGLVPNIRESTILHQTFRDPCEPT
jgi:hypothetical protein